MKRNVRKLLSLALVVILLVGMVPAALAAPINIGGITWSPSTTCELFGTHKIQYQSGGGAFGFAYTCYCGATGFGVDSGSNNHLHSLVYAADGTTGYHYVWCNVAGCAYGSRELHTATCPCNENGGTGTGTGIGTHNHQYAYHNATHHKVTCTNPTCSYYTGIYEPHSETNCPCAQGSSGTHNHLYSYYSPTHHKVTCTDSTCSYYAGAYEVHSGTGYCTYCNYNYGTGSGVASNVQWSTPTCPGSQYGHTPYYYQSANGYDYYYCSNPTCSASGTGVTGMGGTGTGGTGTGIGGTGSAVGTNGKLYVSAYDSMSDDTYTLNETVTLSVSPTMWESNTNTTANYNYTYTWAGNVYAADSTSSTVYLDTTLSSCTAYCTVTAYNKTGDTATAVDTATVYWTATAIATDSIIYTALTGSNVKLDASDFQNFWAKQYPQGTLNYVRFTGVSTGNLYDNYAGGATLRTDVRARSASCYLSPAINQIGLDDLTYVPSAYGNVNSVTIQFTAYGTSNYGYSSGWGPSYGTTSLPGTVTILYTAKEITPIVYSVLGTSVALDADDFTAKYKEVMNVTYPGTLSIQFLEAPAYGTLSLNYGSNYWYQGSTIKLTDTNIGTYSFSTSTVGTYSIDNLTYTPGATGVGDTIRFVCYSGSQLKFVGTVTFGASEQYTVEFITSAGKAVKFDAASFNEADSTHMLTSGYIYFGTSTAGTLYENYANGTGTRVTASDTYTAAKLGTVTFVPRLGFVGVAEIPYTAYTYMGQQISGTVKVYVGRNFTDVLGTASAWAAPYINKLSAQGIVNGTDTGMTKYNPTKTVTYGEALKLIMMAAGYPEQAKTGTHWASGYLTKAYADGLVSVRNLDLNAEITRNDIATLAAKALKLSSATRVNVGITGPSDSTNGYVYALYNAGIINGVNEGGKNYYYGTRSIIRAEISKIICTVNEYYEANN